ncbi:MAG: dihydroorotase [Sarcina sp.]
MELLIKNANIVDKAHNFYGDIYIKNGIIKEISDNIDKNCKVIDAGGKIVMPAFIDTHAHFRDPGFTHKEDIETGSKAAVRGGYTAVTLMGNTNPISSTIDVINMVENRAKEIGLVDAYQCATITKNLDGKTLSHLEAFEGTDRIKVITDDGKGVCDSNIMYQAMLKAKENNWIIMSHAEDHDLSKISMRLAENMMTHRDVELAKYTGARLHMSHVSTIEAIDYIKRGKEYGANVTCEVTPHHIFLDTTKSNYRVNPPIREKEDVTAIIDAIRLGVVDCIGTDHAPHTDEEKAKGAPGMTGIEIAFSICYTKLVKEQGMSLNKLSDLMSGRAGEILGINKGKIQIGFDGDLVILDTEKEFVVDRQKLVSKSKNTPFDGITLSGDIDMTIKAGKVVYSKEM